MSDPPHPEGIHSPANSGQQADSFNLNLCEQEPIHVPGSIQPFGYLTAFTEEGTIKYLSSNTEELSGKPATGLIGKHLREVIGEEPAGEILRKVKDAELKPGQKIYLYSGLRKHGGAVISCEQVLHRIEGLIILESEPSEKRKAVTPELDSLNESMQGLQEAKSVEELSLLVAEKFKELSGFNRVMVYRFHEDGSGEVIAEAKEARFESYLGLRYPASDIPQQVRDLYRLNPVRVIADVHYTPVPIISPVKENIVKQPDLSYSALRGVSPVHIRYLKNMGTAATMSVAIMKDNQLWGLVAFHHESPYSISYQYRQLCVLLCRVYSLVLTEKEAGFIQEYKNKILEVQSVLFRRLSGAGKLADGLFKQKPTAIDMINCGGCIVFSGGEITSAGNVPDGFQVRELINWLSKTCKENLFCTSELPKLYKPALQFKESGSGILAVSISQVQQEYVIWFRPEKVRTVTWAGAKEKEVSGDIGQLNPGKSFEAWSEQIRNTSEAWLPVEKEAATALRNFVVDMVFRLSGELKLKADILSRINKELGSENSELDSSAYILSHDLKEPLRGIQQYATFLLEDYASVLDKAGQAKLQSLVRMSNRMQQLIQSLLHFSRMGRFEIHPETVNMDEVVQEVLEIFGQQIVQEGVKAEVEKNFPAIFCDRLLAGEVLTNLISNSLKYNQKEPKEIFIGFRKSGEGEISPSGYVFFVKDNGIGIDPKYQDQIFIIFKRLHGRDDFGGGTGAGLTITKKIVERHGGQIWVDSSPGQGAVFYFSL